MVTSGNIGLRALACVCAAVALCVCAQVAPASAATSIGQLDPGTPTGSCPGVSGWLQSAESGAPSYVVPAGQWVLVSWRHRANSATGRDLGLRVWRATGAADSYTLVGAGALRTLTPNAINLFYERIAVSAGDILGLRVGNPPSGPLDFGGGASCHFAAGVGNTIRYGIASSEPAVGTTSTLGAPLTLNRLNVTALLEADADGDGYGDETQDACPGSPGSSSGCGPAPDPGAAPDPAKDTTAPAAKLSARRRDSIRDRRVAVWVTASESVTATAKGTLGIASHARVHRLRTATVNVVAGKRERMLLRLSTKTRRAARRALRRNKRLRVRVSVTLRDAAGNTGSAKRTVRLRR